MESNGVTSTSNVTFVVPGGVDIYPDNYGTGSWGANVSYSHTVENMGSNGDSFELSVLSTSGWNVSVYADLNGDGVGDSWMATDTGGDGSWDLVSALWDSDSDSNPDTGSMNSQDTFDIVVEIEIPAGSGNWLDTTFVNVTSNNFSAASDSAIDVTEIPEFSDIAVPVFAMLLMFIIIRNKKGGRKRHEEAEEA